MPYWQIVTASFRIPWRHRYLWLLAIFAGEGASSGSFNFSSGNTYRSPTGATGANVPDPAAIAQQVGTWLQDHLGLIVAIAVAWLMLAILFFILAAVCEAAVVRAAAEHDAERPFSLGPAWRTGVNRMGAVIRFRLLILLLGLPIVLVVGGLIAIVALAAIRGQTGAAVSVGILAGFVLLAAIPYGIYLGFLGRLGSRALVLEQLQGWPSIVRGHRLLRKRLGRTLLVWLISIAVAAVAGVALGIASLAVAIPAVALALTAVAAKSAVLWVVFAVYILLLVAVVIVASSFVAAQNSTYWTLAFRRLDIDYPPAQPLAYPPPAPPR